MRISIVVGLLLRVRIAARALHRGVVGPGAHRRPRRDRDPRRPPARSRGRPRPHEPGHPVEGTRIRDVGPNVAIPAGAQVIDLSRMTVHAGAGRRAQPPRAHLQAGAREQHLLLHLRAGLDGAARDPGGVERHPDARVGLHDRPRHGQQRQLRRHGAAPGDRAGLDSRARRSSTPGIIIGGMGGQFFPTPEMAKDHNIVYPGVPRRRHAATRSSRRFARTCCSARR